MSKTTTTHASRKTYPAPRLTLPLEGEAVEGLAAIFTWEAVPGATTYQFQIARDADFEDVYIDTVVENSTALTIYSMLPQDGATFYWRVRVAGEDNPWSEPVRFFAATATDAVPTRVAAPSSPSAASSRAAASTRAAALPSAPPGAAPPAAASESETVPPPYLYDVTPKSEIVTAFLVMLVTILIVGYGIAVALP